jgi:hypothetical protein
MLNQLIMQRFREESRTDALWQCPELRRKIQNTDGGKRGTGFGARWARGLGERKRGAGARNPNKMDMPTNCPNLEVY